MRDSRVGTFAVIGLILFVRAKDLGNRYSICLTLIAELYQNIGDGGTRGGIRVDSHNLQPNSRFVHAEVAFREINRTLQGAGRRFRFCGGFRFWMKI